MNQMIILTQSPGTAHPTRTKTIAVLLNVTLIICLVISLSSCKTMESVTDLGASIGSATGVLSQSQAESLSKSGRAVARTFQDITPEQEYYIGRTVGAMVLAKYAPYNHTRLNRYINRLGQTLAKASDRPETFGGYHFLVQNSNDINAFAAPGGLIFITRGMLRLCRNEDALAAVLAHEIAHVQLQHGLQAIKKSRITSALATIGMESSKTFGGRELASLTSTFEDVITDITTKMINNGYSRAFEHQADQAAVTILKRVGYNPHGLTEMLTAMQKKLKPGGLDFAKTHPSPQSRIADITKIIGAYTAVKSPKARQVRFLNALKGV